MLQIEKLRKSYHMKDQDIPVLQGVDCTITKGEFVSILGPSGCGKSTLLNIIAGLDRASSGEILYEGKPTGDFEAGEWDLFRKEHIGIVFQSFNLIPHLSAIENVELAMSVAACSKRSRRKRAKELLKQVGLGDRMKSKPNQLSGGERQRVAIARALANNPEIILADEPTGALDSNTSDEIMRLFRSLNREYGVTILMVTHNEMIAQQTDRNIFMMDGIIIGDKYLEYATSLENEDNKFKVIAACDKKRSRTASHMKFCDSISIAVRNIILKKKRSILTVFGISVGIFSVVIMFGITNGISNKINSELNSISNASIVKILTQNHTESEIQTMVSDIENNSGVTAAEKVYILSGTIAYQDKFSEDALFSYGSSSKAGDLLYGSYPKDDGEIVVNEKMAEKFAGKDQVKDLIGKKVSIYVAYDNADSITYSVEKECMVVGITSTNLFGYGNNYISYDDAKAISKESAGKEVSAQSIFTYLTDSKYRNTIIKSVEQKGYAVSSSKDKMDKINTWINAIQDFMLLIIGTSLVVACVMVVIVQYMSVAERIKEIGILRAIGAKKQDVRNIFLLEAGVIGMAAGVIGISTAVILGNMVNAVVKEIMTNNAFHLYWMKNQILIECMIISIALCLIAGYLPARKAATVDPIEVLR